MSSTSSAQVAGESIQTEVGKTHEAMKNVRRDMIPTRFAPGGCPRQSCEAGRPPSRSFVAPDRTKPMSMTQSDVQRFQTDDLAINYLVKDLGRGEEHNIRGRTNKLPANLVAMTEESKKLHRIDIPDLREATLKNQVAHSDKHKNTSFTAVIDPKSEFLKNKYHNLYNRTSTPLRAVMGLDKPYEKSSEEHRASMQEKMEAIASSQEDAESEHTKSIRERLTAYQSNKLAAKQQQTKNKRPSSRQQSKVKYDGRSAQRMNSHSLSRSASRQGGRFGEMSAVSENHVFEADVPPTELTHDALAAHHAKHVSPWDNDAQQARPQSAISFRSSKSSMRELEDRVAQQESEISDLRAQLERACQLMERDEFKKPLT